MNAIALLWTKYRAICQRGITRGFQTANLTSYLRGQAYLRGGDSAPALAEFQRILDHRGAAPFAPLYPLAQLGRARAYAAQGNRESSRAAYENFFALWKMLIAKTSRDILYTPVQRTRKGGRPAS